MRFSSAAREIHCERNRTIEHMRILIYGANYFPELTGIGKYSGEMGAWLAARGHEVRVVTAPPYYPEWRVAEGYCSFGFRREVIDGVAVYRCPLWVPRRPSGVRRLLHLASFAVGSLPAMLWQVPWKPERVIVIEPPLICAPAGLMLAWLAGARSWLHVQDFEIDAAFNLGILSRPLLRKTLLRLERYLMRRFDRASSISRNMVDLLNRKGVEPARCVQFPNWVESDQIFPCQPNSSLRAELGVPPGGTIALYAGNMGMKQGLDVILRAARLLAGEGNIHFVLCGDGAARKGLMSTFGDLSNVTWSPLQPRERLNELLNLADVHLLPQSDDVADLVMPSKLAGMLASGRPVLATARPGTQIAQVVEGKGLITAPGDVPAIVNALRLLAADAELRVRLGGAGRAYAVKNLDKRAILQEFESELINC